MAKVMPGSWMLAKSVWRSGEKTGPVNSESSERCGRTGASPRPSSTASRCWTPSPSSARNKPAVGRDGDVVGTLARIVERVALTGEVHLEARASGPRGRSPHLAVVLGCAVVGERRARRCRRLPSAPPRALELAAAGHLGVGELLAGRGASAARGSGTGDPRARRASVPARRTPRGPARAPRRSTRPSRSRAPPLAERPVARASRRWGRSGRRAVRAAGVLGEVERARLGVDADGLVGEAAEARSAASACRCSSGDVGSTSNTKPWSFVNGGARPAARSPRRSARCPTGSAPPAQLLNVPARLT